MSIYDRNGTENRSKRMIEDVTPPDFKVGDYVMIEDAHVATVTDILPPGTVFAPRYGESTRLEIYLVKARRLKDGGFMQTAKANVKRLDATDPDIAFKLAEAEIRKRSAIKQATEAADATYRIEVASILYGPKKD